MKHQTGLINIFLNFLSINDFLFAKRTLEII